MQYGKPTFVYFIQEGARGPIKIGFSRNVQERLKALQTGHAQPLRVLLAMRGTMEDEQRFHRRFAHLRIQNEWFTPAPELLDWLAKATGGPQPASAPETTPPSAFRLHWAVIAVFGFAGVILLTATLGIAIVLFPHLIGYWPAVIIVWALAPAIRHMARHHALSPDAMTMFVVMGVYVFGMTNLIRVHPVLLPYTNLIIGWGVTALGVLAWRRLW